MDISLDYINKVIARNNANTGAGAQAPASFGNYTGFEGDAPTVARMQENQVQAAIASASARWAAYQQAVQQHQADMQQIRQRDNLKTQERGGSKAKQYDAVQEYLRDNPAAEKLWTAEHTPAPNPQAAAGRKKQAEELRKGMTGAELSAYEQAEKTAKGYGKLYGGARRLQDMTAGALKQAGSSALAFMEGMAAGDEENKRAQWEMRQAVDNGTVFTAPDENGNSVVSDAYKQALKEFEDTKDNEVIIDESFSPALKATRKAAEQISRGGAGLSATAKKAYEVGTSMVQNAPSMAVGLIPGIGPAVGLGMMGLSAAGGRMDELSQQGVGNREAFARGAVSGAIEIATEKLPMDTWTEIITKGGETALRNIAKQAFGEATEEGAGYVMNAISDLAFRYGTGKQKFSYADLVNTIKENYSLQELADSALMGGLSGAGFGAIGTGINRAFGLGSNTNVQQNENVETTQNEQTAVQENGTAQLEDETPQQTAEAEKTMQARRAAAEQLAPLTGLTPEQLLNTAQMENAQATQNTVQSEQQAVESATTGTQETVQNTLADKTQLIQQRNVQAVTAWADSNADFSPEMKRLVKENYAPGANAGLYTTAMQNYYDAGRTGSITYEQAQQMNESRAAAVSNEPLLRAAYEAGRKQAVNVTDPAGTGAVSGRVQYEEGATKGAVLDDGILQAVADKLGVDIKVVHQLADTNGTEANGSFAAGLSQIVLGENSSNAYQTLVHELTHYIGSYAPEQMSDLRNAALRFYAEQSGVVRSTLRQYEASYGNYTLGADEAARDVLSGVMSTEDGARSFLEYITQSDAYTTAQKRGILQTMRDVLETLVQKLRDLLVGGDATETAGKARQIAEQADMLEQRQAMIDQYMGALEDARQNARVKAENRLQSSAEAQQTETAPAASRGGEKYSYAGTEAAQADYDDLHRAQQMELDGEDAEAIRKETGWFRGADYKWRFEIDDSQTVWHREGDYGLQLRDAAYREYKSLMNQMLYGTLTDEQTKRLQQLDKEYKGAANSRWKVLGDYLEAPELYKQYPDLQTLPVSFEDLGKGVNGTMSRLDGLLLSDRLRNADSDYLKRTVLHEVQHWIQTEEGFAGGANPKYWAKRLQQDPHIETKGVRDARGKMQALEEHYPGIAEYANEYGHYESDEQLAALLERAKKDGISEEALDDYYMAQWDAERGNNTDSRTPTQLYYDTAGEQEARDTAKRMRYTAEERQTNKPFTGNSDTVFADQKVDAYSIDPDFDHKITEWDAEGRNASEVFTLGTTSDALKSIGVQDKSIVMVSDKIRRIMREHPEMTLDMIRQIPHMLEEPALVLESSGGSMIGKTTQNSRIVVIGTVTDTKGNPVLSVLDLQPSTGKDIQLGLQDFNKVSSAYAKTTKPKAMLEKSNVLYVSEDTKKADAALNSFSFQFATSELNRTGSIGSIAYDNGKVNIKGVPFNELLKKSSVDTVEDLAARKRALKAAKNAYENSEEVRQLKAARENAKRMYGLFGGGLRTWEAQHPEWGDYVAKRKDYNRQLSALDARTAEINEQGKADLQARQDAQWAEKQAQQKAYDAKVQESGLSMADYHRQEAVKHYGTTENFEAAAYLLPDGQMLDFTEGNAGEQRGADHRNIQTIFGPAELGQNATQADYLNRFIEEGNIRLMPEGPGVDMSTAAKPTKAQLAKISEMAETLGRSKGNFSLDITGENGKQAAGKTYEGRIRGAKVVRDIETYFETGKLPEQSELNKFRYSADTAQSDSDAYEGRAWQEKTASELDKLRKKRTKIDSQIKTLQEEMRISGGHTVAEADVQRAAKRFISENASQYNADLFARELQQTFDSMSRSKNLNVREAMSTLTDLAKGVLEQSVKMNYDLREEYAPVREAVKGMEWTVRENSPAYDELVNRFGDGSNGKKWGNVRKALFGTLNVKRVSADGPAGTFDTNFELLAKQFPGEFAADGDIVTNVERLMQIKEASKPYYENIYGNDLDEAASFAAQDLYDAYIKAQPVNELNREQVQRLRELSRTYERTRAEAMAAQKAAFDAKIADMKQESRENFNERMQGIYDKYTAAQKAGNEALAEKYLRQMEQGYATRAAAERSAALEMRWKTKNDSAERIKARDSVQKSVKELHRWLTQPTADQHVQTRMQKTVLNLLNSIDVNNSVEGTKSAARWQEVMKDVQLMAKDALAADGGLSDTDAYADFDPDLPEAINELMQGNDHARIVDFDVKQMRQLSDILTSMKTSIRNANKMMSDAQGATVEEICRSSAIEMDDERNVLLRERSRLVRNLMGTRTGDAVNGLLNYDMMDARRYFKHLGDTALEKVYKPIRDGFDRRVWLLKSAQEQFEQIRGDTDITKWTGSKAEKHHFTLENGQQIDMTVGQMMELYNLSQREQAHDHLMVGGFTLVDENGKKTSTRVRNLTPTDLASITGALTNEQVKMAKVMSDYLSAKNGPAGWGNEVTQKQYGLDKFNEKHYWPIRSDGNQTRTNDASVGGNAGLWAIKNQGFTKNLTKFANNSILMGDAFDTWSNHIANMATYNAWAIPLSDAMKWYNWHDGVNVSTKEQIEGIGGSRGKAYFTTLMQDINGMSAAPSSTGYASLTKSLTRNWKVAKVGSNLRVAIQQPTAYLRAAAVINQKYLAQAVAYDVGHLKQGIDRAENNCAIALWKSWGYFETNIGQTMKSMLTGQSDALDKVREISTLGAEWGDKITWGTLWNACELEAQDKYGFKPGSEESLKYCGDRLSEIVDKTQVVDSVLHRSQIMRNKDMLTQMATNFFAEPTKTYNMVEDAFLDMVHGKEGAKKNFGRVVATYFAAAAGTALAASLIDALRVKDDDKDKNYWERYKEALYENFVDNVNLINNIPFVKDIQSMLDGYDATRTDLESVSDIIDAVKAWQKYLTGKSKTTPYKLLYKTANAVSGITGIPVGTAVREAKSAYDLFTGLMDPLRIDRQLGRAADDYTYTDLYNQVKAAGGDTNEMKALFNGESYADMLGSGKAANVDKWLNDLAKNTATVDDAGKMQDNTSVLAKHIDNEISYKDADGNDRKAKLKGTEYVTYAKTVQQSTVNLIDEYIHGTGKTASAEQQAAFVKRAREYAVETAREQIILGYKPDSWVQAVQNVSGGKNIAAVIVAREAASGAKSDLDKDGNAISGSKAANGVKALQDLGYDAATAQVLYNQLTGAEDNRYMKLYSSVKSNSTKVHKLAALYGTAGEDTTYAGMLQNRNAQKVDNYLLELSKTQGKDVLPDRMSADFKAGDKDVILSGEQYIDYAEQRTKTAYTLTDALLPNAAKYTKEQQAKIVANIEEYATQTAKAQVSGYEPYSWIRTVEERGATDEERYAYITAKTLISLAKGTKDANGKTISGSKKAAAISSLKQAGYNDAMAKELYKLFG